MYTPIVLFLFSLITSSSTKLLTTTSSCGYNNYDLSSLTSTTADYSYIDKSSSTTWSINICTNTITKCNGKTISPVVWNYGAGININTCDNLGVLHTAIWNNIENGISVSYSGGDTCTTTTDYSSTINFVCDKTSNGKIISINSPDGTCSPSVTFSTSLVCSNGSSSSSDTGSIIFISLFFAIFGVYFIGGIIYNYKTKTSDNESFADMIPHKEFWTSLPGLIFDGCLYSFYLFKLSLFKCGLSSAEPEFIVTNFNGESNYPTAIGSNDKKVTYGTI